MMANRITIDVDFREAKLMLAEISARVRLLGEEEVYRRIGYKIDVDKLIGIELVDKSLRVIIKPAFEELMRKLWE